MRRAKTPQQQCGSRFPAVRVALHFSMAALLLGAAVACTGGNGQPPPGSASAAPAAPTRGAAGPPSVSAQPEDPATAKLRQSITESLRRMAAESPKPSREQVTAALAGTGIPAGALEVSASRTPTGLEVDAIEAAALQGKDCVIGQIRDGSVTVIVLPVLASGKCFAGSPV